jgi:hypothetical protein
MTLNELEEVKNSAVLDSIDGGLEETNNAALTHTWLFLHRWMVWKNLVVCHWPKSVEKGVISFFVRCN